MLDNFPAQERRLKEQLAARYGMTPEAYEAMINGQRGQVPMPGFTPAPGPVMMDASSSPAAPPAHPVDVMFDNARRGTQGAARNVVGLYNWATDGDRSLAQKGGDVARFVGGMVRGAVQDPALVVPGIGDVKMAGQVNDLRTQADDARRYGQDETAADLDAAAALPILLMVAGTKGGGSAADALKGAAKAPRPKAIGKLFDNVTDYSQAMDMARGGEHVRYAKDGQIVGAPRQRPDAQGNMSPTPAGMTVNSPEALDAMRVQARDKVKAGADGADWYERARNETELVATDPKAQKLLARGGAVYSPQSNPNDEINTFIRQHNAKVVSGQDTQPRMRRQAENAQKAYVEGNDGGYVLAPENIKLGKKTGPYADAKDPTVPIGDTYQTANDIWHGRVMGYSNPGGGQFDRAFTPQEHGFLTGENLLLADWADNHGFRPPAAADDFAWHPRSVQAATWVAERRAGAIADRTERLAKYDADMAAWKAGTRKKPTKPQVMTDAEIDAYALAGIDDALRLRPAHQTYEYVTGENTGVLSGLNRAEPAVRDAYSAEMQAVYGDRDPYFEALQVYQYPVVRADGTYVNSKGVTETNPAFVARPLVGSDLSTYVNTKGKVAKGGQKVDEVGRSLLDTVAGVRSVVDAQEGVGWNKFTLANKSTRTADKTGIRVTGAPDQLKAAEGELQKAGLDTVLVGDGALHAGRFMGDWDGKKVTEVAKDLHTRGYHVEQGRFESDLAMAPWGQEEGAVARYLQTQLERPDVHNLPQRLDNSGLPGKIARQNEIIGRYAQEFSTDPRYMNLRKLLGEKGFQGFLDRVRREGYQGLPAVALPVSGGLLQQDEQPSR